MATKKISLNEFRNIVKQIIKEESENNINIVNRSWEDVGLGLINVKFSDGVEIIYNQDDPKIYHPRSRYLNNKDINLYVNIIRKNSK